MDQDNKISTHVPSHTGWGGSQSAPWRWERKEHSSLHKGLLVLLLCADLLLKSAQTDCRWSLKYTWDGPHWKLEVVINGQQFLTHTHKHFTPLFPKANTHSFYQRQYVDNIWKHWRKSELRHARPELYFCREPEGLYLSDCCQLT